MTGTGDEATDVQDGPTDVQDGPGEVLDGPGEVQDGPGDVPGHPPLGVRVTAGLLMVLAASRLVGLNRSLWEDEAYTAWAYVLRGPSTIRAADSYIANNHLLYSAVTWAWTELVGHSEVALRTWAIVPGTAASVWLAWWVGRRLGWWTAAAVTMLTLVSALQAQLVTEARGYGLVLVASVGLLVGGVDAIERSRRRDDLTLMLSALIGALTVPTVAIPAAVTGIVVAFRGRHLGRLIGGGAVVGAIGVWWYWPVLPALLAGADRVGARWGEPAGVTSPLFAPADLLAGPSIEHLVPNSWAWLRPGVTTTVVAAALFWAGCVALHRRSPATARIVVVVPAATMVVLAVIGFHLLPRYVAFLLPAVLVGVAAGCVWIFATLWRRAPAVAVAAGTLVVALLAVGGWQTVIPELTVPRQELQGIADVARDVEPATVLQAAHHIGLTYYLGDHNPELIEDPAELARRVCTAPEPVLYVPPVVDPAPLPPCLEVRGFREVRFDQRARPGTISVWVLDATNDRPTADGRLPAPTAP